MSKKLEQEIVEAIKKVFDPEIPVNIYELGLIYKIDIEKECETIKHHKAAPKIRKSTDRPLIGF